jgi:trigger factor
LEVRIEAPEAGKRELFISIESKTLTPKFEQAYQDYKKKIVLGGFRKGRVPLALIEKMFGKSIRDEVIDRVIPEFSQEAIDLQKFKIIPPAQIDAVDYDAEKGLSFKVFVELQPEIELKKISDFEFERETYEADPAAVDWTLDSIREKHATMKTIDDEAKDLDLVSVDLQQIDVTGVAIIGQKYENQQFQIDSNDDAAYKLTRQFLGVKSGETRQIEIEMPGEDAENPAPAFYMATIKEVQTKILPELDDEFAKDVGEYQTLQALKDSILSNMIRRLKYENYQRFQSLVIDRLVKENSFEVPEKLVDLQVELFVNDLIKNQPKKTALDPKRMQDYYRPETVWRLKWQMIRNKIEESEKLSLTDEDFEAYYQEQAVLQGTEVERIRNHYLDEQAKTGIEPVVLEQKIVNFVVQQSRISEKVVPYSEILAQKNKVISE